MSNFVFKPTKQQIEKSNIFKFMKKNNISTLADLSKKSKDNPDWFWNAVNEDIGIIWDKKYTIVSDFSNGKPWPKWFVDGKINIINSTVEKFAKRIPNKIAYCFVSEKIGKIAKPKIVCVISDMPKTRTGKVMRRLLRAKLLGEDIGDISTLENSHVLSEIKQI